MQTNNIIELFIDSAVRNADKKVFIHDAVSVTYKELLAQVQCQAVYFRNKGIGKGSRVLVLAPMSVALYRTVLALLYLGACPVFLDEWVSKERLKRCCDTVPCDAMITTGKLLLYGYFVKQLRQIPIKIRLNGGITNIGEVTVAEVDKQDTALITFTTGSTGIPKAANRTHAFLKAQYDVLHPLLDNGAGVSLTMLPVVVLINIGMGKTIVLPPVKFVAKDNLTTPFVTKALLKHRVEEIIASPAILQDVCSNIRQTGAGVSSVRYLLTGGGAVFPELATMVLSTFPGVSGRVVYGSTEAEPISHLSLKEVANWTVENIQKQGLPVGMCDESVSVAIIPYNEGPWPAVNKAAFEKLKVPEGVTGEIVVTGQHVLKGYINNPDAVRRHKINVDEVVWHRTGDVGVLVNGRLLFYGPCKEVILYNGVIYYPVICCYVFSRLTGVQAALLVLNGMLMLVIEAIKPVEPGLLVDALQKTRMETVNVVYVSAIPRDPRHQTKVDYDALRKGLKTGKNLA